eukprot:COSAG02_NODE_383_length_23407_cov_6.710014_1_plen_54_part_00
MAVLMERRIGCEDGRTDGRTLRGEDGSSETGALEPSVVGCATGRLRRRRLGTD